MSVFHSFFILGAPQGGIRLPGASRSVPFPRPLSAFHQDKYYLASVIQRRFYICKETMPHWLPFLPHFHRVHLACASITAETFPTSFYSFSCTFKLLLNAFASHLSNWRAPPTKDIIPTAQGPCYSVPHFIATVQQNTWDIVVVG